LPKEAPPNKTAAPLASTRVPPGTYNPMTSRDIFNADGIMPPALQAQGSDKTEQEDVPVLSSLPLNLIGTIVFAVPDKSIATIELKGKNLVQAFSVGSEIDNIAKLEKVEREKVIFRNLNNNRLEYIEMKSTSKISFKAGPVETPTAKAASDVIQTAPNKYEIKRSDLLKYTNNLNEILQQARAVPDRDPNTGEIRCFRILDLAPGSIYEKFGVQRMDCISSVNGQEIKSPQQALEMYNALKNSSNVSIGFERGGTKQNSDFTVK
ncbi:MAG: type II secretion system protein GspC, partial [Pseudobdellovibrionaceae bacterium]